MSTAVVTSEISPSTARLGQALLIAALMAVLALLVVPLPHTLLDVFLGLNMLFAFTVMLVSVSVNDVLKLSSVPTLLLLCTLFRLTLNIASARLILSEGEAGQVIAAFGDFVARGNIVVGLILFAILMIVQFLVVAKGSERVAEVAARFTLDAMPGKQMSIDADLRAGMIDATEAQRLRDELSRESRLYAALDGAMKFVKGETIAGFIILAVNLCAGWIIGVVQLGMEPLQAVRTFSMLTVGEGLASEVPALMAGLAAGFLVTKVGGRDAKPIGAEMGSQILAHPRVLLVAGGAAFLLALIPSFPRGVFLVFSLGAFAAGLGLLMTVRRREQDSHAITRHVVLDGSAQDALAMAWPLLVELGPAMYDRFLSDARWRQCFDVLYPALRVQLMREMGVPFPDLKIAVNAVLPPETYRIRIFEVVVDQGSLSTDHCMIRRESLAADHVPILNPGESDDQTRHGTPALHLHLARENELRGQGYQVIPPEDRLLRYVARVLRKHAADFVGIQSVREILTQVEAVYPELVRETVPRLLSIQKLTEVVRRLVEEGICIRDFRQILEVLSSVQADARDPVALTELVRVGLRRQITQRFASADGRIRVFMLDPDVEEEIRASIRREGADTYLALPPERVQAISAAASHAVTQHGVSPSTVVVMASADVRRFVRKVLETTLPDLAILSFQELEPSVLIDQLDVISVSQQILKYSSSS